MSVLIKSIIYIRTVFYPRQNDKFKYELSSINTVKKTNALAFSIDDIRETRLQLEFSFPKIQNARSVLVPKSGNARTVLVPKNGNA